MYSVYKITNLINNKCYIGSSIRVEKRWREHQNAAFCKNNSAYNYPLQQAFRKYGIENFSFEILSDDFEDIASMQKYEQDMIIYYNSYFQGYNQTLNTDSNHIACENMQKHIETISQACAKVDKNNNILEIYKSYHDAAKRNNLDGDIWATKIRNVCKGKSSSINNDLIFRDLDSTNNIIYQPFKNYKGRKPLIGINLNDCSEIYFDSISQAAEQLSTDRKSIQQCIQGNSRHSTVKGYVLRELDIDGNIIEINPTIESIIEEYNRTNPIIDGVRHNIKEWCEIYGITKSSYYYRLKKGMTVIEAITKPKKGADESNDLSNQ